MDIIRSHTWPVLATAALLSATSRVHASCPVPVALVVELDVSAAAGTPDALVEEEAEIWQQVTDAGGGSFRIEGAFLHFEAANDDGLVLAFDMSEEE